MTDAKSISNSDKKVVVIGAGPAGIVCALELAKNGVSVVLVESGNRNHSPRIQELATANTYDPTRHASMGICTRRQLGGASVIWGGRCIPYDPVDFSKRDYIPHSSWPVSYNDVQPFFQEANDYCFCGKAVFTTHEIESVAQKTIVPGFEDIDVRACDLERWSLPTNFGREYVNAIRNSKHIELMTGWTATRIRCNNSGTTVTSIECRNQDGQTINVCGKAFIIACGGLETTRLLLASNEQHPAGIGGQGGVLGQYYMGHISGRIAKVKFSGNARKTIFGFLRDNQGVYLRPRFTFTQECQHHNHINNVSLSLVNSTIGDPSHGNGVLSFAYLALASPLGGLFASEALRQSALKGAGKGVGWAHVRNMIRNWYSTGLFIPTFAVRRFLLRRRIPGFFQYSADNQYVLHYHGEQIPNPLSRVTLSSVRDELGLPKLDIDLRFSQQDVESVIKCHSILDQSLRRQQLGSLEYFNSNSEESVWSQASDGYHQVGTTRMCDDANGGVVDRNCKVHGIENLYVSSSSVFVTSSQANSTFMIVVFAVRLAKHLAKIYHQHRLSA